MDENDNPLHTPKHVSSIKSVIENSLDPESFEIHQFKIGQYNDAVTHPRWHLPFDKNTLAFCVINTPQFFENIVVPYFKQNYDTVKSPVDESAHAALSVALDKLRSLGYSQALFYKDSDTKFTGQPEILVQVVGHVSGAVYFHRPTDETRDTLGKKNLMGVCLHNKYGGWFAIRAVFIIPEIKISENVSAKLIFDYDSNATGARAVELFNTDWRSNAWRDVIPVEQRYSPRQTQFFTTPAKDRRQLLLKWLDLDHSSSVSIPKTISNRETTNPHNPISNGPNWHIFAVFANISNTVAYFIRRAWALLLSNFT